MSVSETKFGCANLIFVVPGVMINGTSLFVAVTTAVVRHVIARTSPSSLTAGHCTDVQGVSDSQPSSPKLGLNRWPIYNILSMVSSNFVP